VRASPGASSSAADAQAAAMLLNIGDAAVAEPDASTDSHVSVILGVTSDPDKPVALRLGLPTLGLLLLADEADLSELGCLFPSTLDKQPLVECPDYSWLQSPGCSGSASGWHHYRKCRLCRRPVAVDGYACCARCGMLNQTQELCYGACTVEVESSSSAQEELPFDSVQCAMCDEESSSASTGAPELGAQADGVLCSHHPSRHAWINCPECDQVLIYCADCSGGFTDACGCPDGPGWSLVPDMHTMPTATVDDQRSDGSSTEHLELFHLLNSPSSAVSPVTQSMYDSNPELFQFVLDVEELSEAMIMPVGAPTAAITPEIARRILARLQRDADAGSETAASHLLSRGDMLRQIVAADPAAALMTVSESPISTGFVAALCDNGASRRVSCTKSLAGAVPSSFQSLPETLSVGDKDSGLRSLGSYDFVLERQGSNGETETVVRRMKHTPNLHLPMVISEGTEVYDHAYRFTFERDAGRVMTTDTGQHIPLFITSGKLGWLRVRPITDPDKVKEALDSRKPILAVLGDGLPHTVGMPRSRELRGVALLRRRHIAGGHMPLRTLLITLHGEGLLEGRITKDDIAAYCAAGCGHCESARMKRRPFTMRTIVDKTVPEVGKVWVGDALSLTVPSAYHGYVSLMLFADRNSHKHKIFGMLGETADDHRLAHQLLANEVRPDHGEIFIVRKDSHPTHRSVAHIGDLASSGQASQLSPGGVHEGVGPAEVAFMHGVPAGNALLLGSPDLDRPHEFTAIRTAIYASDYTASGDHNPPSSANMRYFGVTKWMPCPYYIYGSAAKAFVHPEFRNGKGDLHAKPVVYAGPALNSASQIHCCVWQSPRYFDVDIGCLNVDERLVIQRSLRTHPSHQPYNQVGAPHVDIEPDTSSWFDPRSTVHPAELVEKAVAKGGADEELIPVYSGPIWLSHAPVPTLPFTVGVGSGPARGGDLAGWIHHLSDGACIHVRIDKKVGGYEHRYDRPDVHAALRRLLSHVRCEGAVLQPTCGPWSRVKFETRARPTDGTEQTSMPSPIFTTTHPNGIPNEGGAVVAMAQVNRSVELARVVLTRRAMLVVEHPAWVGKGSFLAMRGLEEHSGMFQTEPFRDLIAEFSLVSVYTDQGASGHDKEKKTELLCDELTSRAMREQLGTRAVAEGWKSATAPLIGKDAKGGFVTSGAERFAPLFCQRFATGVLATRSSPDFQCVDGGVVSPAPPTVDPTAPVVSPAAPEVIPTAPETPQSEVQDDSEQPKVAEPPFPPDTRVDIYWETDCVWYSGVVTSVGKQRVKLKGRMLTLPTVRILYDDGETRIHRLDNTSIRSEGKLVMILSTDGLASCLQPPDSPKLSSILAERDEWTATCIANDNVHASQLVALHASSTDNTSTNDTSAPVAVEPRRMHESMESRMKASRGEVLSVTDLEIDLETGNVVNTLSLFLVGDDGKLEKAASLSTVNAKHWHEPRNEREYLSSPQRALWRTAKELKWDQYLELNMFEWVPLSSVDQKTHKIYNTLWVHKIKFNEGLVFKKLNPRWCLKGGTMDRDLYKAHAETLRFATYRTVLSLKGGYWLAFCDFLLDCSDAFQTTRTDGIGKESGGQLEKSTPLFCWPAPGFERRTENGERMVCQVNVGMQGRIDATRLFNANLFNILLKKANMFRLVWDKQVAVYHCGPHENSCEPLSKILLAIKTAKDTDAQSPPIGYAVIGWHVDDGTGVACSVGWNLDPNQNRVVQFIKGCIEITYATTLTGWHGNKSLGFTLTLDEVRHTVNMSAMDAIKRLAADLFKGITMIAPKHIRMSDLDDIPPGVIPHPSDPDYPTIISDMQLCRHGLGASIWIGQAHPEAVEPTNVLTSNMQFPHERTLKALRYQTMHLLEHSQGISFGGRSDRFGLERSPGEAATRDPYVDRPMYLHWFSDASNNVSSRTGGVGMLARGCILPLSQRQHLKNPCAHSSEVTSAGTNLHMLIPVTGVCQELHIQLGERVPFYLDSATTVFVATSDTAAKKSVWIVRRIAVLEDGITHGEFEPLHISERDMAADPLTKYLPQAVWSRHMHYITNRAGHVPSYPGKNQPAR
jgi:hypothetical protein